MQKRTLQIFAGVVITAALGGATVTAVAEEGAPDPFAPQKPTTTVATDVGPGTSVEGDVVTVTGIVPDTVTAVSVELGDGSVKALKPVNNAYLGRLTTADQPETIVYHTADGTREFPVLLPDLAAITKHELQRSAPVR